MKEILVEGNPSKDFERLKISPKLTYGSNDTEYKIYELSEEEFKILCDDATKEEIEGEWDDCGWRYAEGSNQGVPNETVTVNNKDLKCWYEYDEELEEDEESFKFSYVSLLEYLELHMGCTAFRNVCALAMDLAKYNNVKMSDLFKTYQG